MTPLDLRILLAPLLDVTRLVSGAGLRYLAETTGLAPKDDAVEQQADVEKRWAEIQRHAGSVATPQVLPTTELTDCCSINPFVDSPAPPPVQPRAPARSGGWGPMAA